MLRKDIRELTKAGLARAKARGVKLGKHCGGHSALVVHLQVMAKFSNGKEADRQVGRFRPSAR